MTNAYKSPHSAIALFSGGLDSLLAVKWMQKRGYKVYPVYFLTPYMPPARALESARNNGIDLIIRDISERHLEMMQDPTVTFGKHMNPCVDCHALMFKVAGEMLNELDAQYLISGEVVGQRPMSQRRDAMNRVGNLSGFKDLLVRPLSQLLLPDTLPIREGWVDIADMLQISGRGRYRQLEMAEELGITNFPSPAGGCLLTDRNYSMRLKDLMQYGQMDPVSLELLKYGRHFRLNEEIKLIIGRYEAENTKLEELRLDNYLIAKDCNGPLGVLNPFPRDPAILELAKSIFWHYNSKASNPGIAQIIQGDDITDTVCRKANRETVLQYMIALYKQE